MKDIRFYKRCGVQYAYVLDSIQSDEVELTTDKERIEYFFRIFHLEGNCEYKRKLYPNEQERIAQYLRGLPSCCGIAFSYYDIIEVGKSWGYVLDDKRKVNKFLARWWSIMALRLMQIRDRYMNK